MPSLEEDRLMPIVKRPNVVMSRGRGSILWDTEGREYLDFVQGLAVNALGHCPDEVVQALSRQAELLITPGPALHNAPQLQLAEQLARVSGLDQAYFCGSGAEANEVAIKLARKWGSLHRKGAYEVVTTHDSFHGRTLAMMAASGKPGFDSLFPPLPPGFKKVPFGDLDAIKAAIGPSTVALMVEPIQGEAGVVVPPPGYLAGLRAIADREGLLLILDEIQTGMGRTGTLFAHQADRIAPDIMTVGKGLGGGVAIAAVLANTRASCFVYGDQGGTFHGNPLVTAAALAVLEKVSRPEFLARVRTRGAYLEAGLERLARELGGGTVRGRGLLWAIVLPEPRAASIVDRCFDEGLVLNAARPNILRWMPSLEVTEAEIDRALRIVGRCAKASQGLRGSCLGPNPTP